jgi:magnesium-transporting ATPase (P-type)
MRIHLYASMFIVHAWLTSPLNALASSLPRLPSPCAGNDTKIQRSNLEGEKPKTKVSFIMRQVNQYLIYMLLLQSCMCLVGGILAGIYRKTLTINMWYLSFERGATANQPAAATGIYAFFSWFILLSQMVPISLIVSSELVKFIQSLFIEKDIQLYYAKLNKPTRCNSSTIHEDLGLIGKEWRGCAGAWRPATVLWDARDTSTAAH